MTNKEAIEILESIREINEVDPAMINNDDCEALDKAINALIKIEKNKIKLNSLYGIQNYTDTDTIGGNTNV